MYRKEFFVFDQDKPVPVVIRNYEEKDFPGLIQIQQESFPPPFPSELWWNEEAVLPQTELIVGPPLKTVGGFMAGCY